MRREDFTKELLACIEPTCSRHRVLTVWEPDSVAAPERHFKNGMCTDISKGEQYKALIAQNNAFDIIESLLNLQMHKSVCETYVETIDVEKEQVWLFAFYWLRRYYNELMEPDVMYSLFYRQDHDRFIELLTKMCAFRPEKRITFLDAARLWCPGMLRSPDVSDNETDASDDVPQSEPSSDVVSPIGADALSSVGSSLDDVMGGPSMNLPPSSDSSVRRRLVLKGLHGPQGRSKTRKSSRN
jgi:hypothetical protein